MVRAQRNPDAGAPMSAVADMHGHVRARGSDTATEQPGGVDAGSSSCTAGTYTKRTPRWEAETYDQIRAWLAEGVSARAISGRLGAHWSTLRYRCDKAGIDLPGPEYVEPERMKAAAAVLREHFENAANWRDVFALYCAARGDNPTRAAMSNHAGRLNLFRPTYHLSAGEKERGNAVRGEQWREWRLGQARAVQNLINEGMSRIAAAKESGIGVKTIHRMFRDGMLTQPPKPPRPLRVKAPKPPKPIKPPAPRKLPASYVRAEAPPPKPRPTYESVEAWLAAGNAVTRCPTAAAERTTATIPEADMAALRDLYARREADRPKGPNGAAMKAKVRQKGIAQGWSI